MKVKINEQIVENCSIRFLDHENMVIDTDIVFSRYHTYRAMDDLTLRHIGRLLHNARRTTPVTLSDSSAIKTYILNMESSFYGL